MINFNSGFAVICDKYGDPCIEKFEKIRKISDVIYEISIPIEDIYDREIKHFKLTQVHISKIFENKKDALLMLKELLTITLNTYKDKIKNIEDELKTI